MSINQTLAHTTDIAAAYLSNNQIPATEVPNLISSIFSALDRAFSPPAIDAAKVQPEPAVSIRASVKPDHIICLECGAKHKMLKRHLMTAHGLEEGEYRQRWNLPDSYPLTAPNYAQKRRELALKFGLGRKAG